MIGTKMSCAGQHKLQQFVGLFPSSIGAAEDQYRRFCDAENTLALVLRSKLLIMRRVKR